MPVRIRDEEEFYGEDDDALDDFDQPAEKDLGPDERDLDLMDGTWEQDYYAGRMRTRDWNGITVGIALLVVIALVLPMLLVFFD